MKRSAWSVFRCFRTWITGTCRTIPWPTPNDGPPACRYRRPRSTIRPPSKWSPEPSQSSPRATGSALPPKTERLSESLTMSGSGGRNWVGSKRYPKAQMQTDGAGDGARSQAERLGSFFRRSTPASPDSVTALEQPDQFGRRHGTTPGRPFFNGLERFGTVKVPTLCALHPENRGGTDYILGGNIGERAGVRRPGFATLPPLALDYVAMWGIDASFV